MSGEIRTITHPFQPQPPPEPQALDQPSFQPAHPAQPTALIVQFVLSIIGDDNHTNQPIQPDQPPQPDLGLPASADQLQPQPDHADTV